MRLALKLNVPTSEFPILLLSARSTFDVYPRKTQLSVIYGPKGDLKAPHILLEETGIEYEGLAQRTAEKLMPFPEEFRKINPKMRVPVVAIDDEVITELPAVNTAISSLKPDAHLLGKTTIDTIRAYEWMAYLSEKLHQSGFGHYLRPQRFTNANGDLESVKAKACDLVRECYAHIEEHLNDVYAIGGAFTAVDAMLFTYYRWGNNQGFDMKPYPKYRALAEKVAQRKSTKSVLEIEGISSSL